MQPTYLTVHYDPPQQQAHAPPPQYRKKKRADYYYDSNVHESELWCTLFIIAIVCLFLFIPLAAPMYYVYY